MRRFVTTFGPLFFWNCLVLAGLLALLDLGFRAFERRHWTHELTGYPESYPLRALGYNTPDVPVPAASPPGTDRLLSLGDSFAYGVVHAQYNYAEVMAGRLGQALGRPVEALNLGTPNVSFPEYIREIRYWTPRLGHAGVVATVFAGNDFQNAEEQDPANATLVEPPATRPHGLGVFLPRGHWLRVWDYIAVNHMAFMAMRQVTDRRYSNTLIFDEKTFLTIQARNARSYLPEDLASHGRGLAWCRLFMRELKRLQDGGTPVLVAVAPPNFLVDPTLRGQVEARLAVPPGALRPDLPGAVVRELARREGLPEATVFDLTPCLQARASANPGEDLYLSRNTHWSLHGNEVVGGLLALAIGHVWHGLDAGEAAAGFNEAPRDAAWARALP